jgi:ERF superfamily
MHSSSPSIGAIAAALAKAQLDLANPSKSLVGTIPGMTPNGDRSFRYAPLSSGLDLVRKSLGRHEIATVQTTAIDREAGLIRLTTVLAHSSGEWISSDWPVCAVSETAAPQRMGAALTYARRHSLFALVGIAGDDDVDAPDLPVSKGDEGQDLSEKAVNPGQMNGHEAPPGHPIVGSRGKHARTAPKPILSTSESAILRDRLLSDLAGFAARDSVLDWACQILPDKNALVQEDARAIETAFETKIAALGSSDGDRESAITPCGNGEAATANGESARPQLAIPKTRRKRDKRHLEFVASKPCLVCGRSPSDAHHLRFAEPRALGRKVSDEFTVPLCRIHHRDLHRHSDEEAWWAALKLDAKAVAQQLWRETHAAGS